MPEDPPSEQDEDADSPSPLRGVAAIAGAVLVGTYLLPWVELVADTNAGEAGDTVAASDIVVLPELVVALGLVTVAIALWRWDRPAHLAALLCGIVGTGLGLYVRSFLGSGDTVLEVGSHQAPATAFEPALGPTVVLATSAMLVGVGFASFLGSFESGSGFGPPTRNGGRSEE